jgi:osmotically-inducible protein OsmY
MNDLQTKIKTKTKELSERIEANVRRRAWGRVCNFQVVVRDRGIVLRGRTRTYYGKQMVQEAAAEAAGLPILANEVEVR